MVVIGDLIGSGEAHERGIVGETPNLAARLQAIAEPDTLVIADGTRRLLGNLFELEEIQPGNLKGISGPVRVWKALPSYRGSASISTWIYAIARNTSLTTLRRNRTRK